MKRPPFGVGSSLRRSYSKAPALHKTLHLLKLIHNTTEHHRRGVQQHPHLLLVQETKIDVMDRQAIKDKLNSLGRMWVDYQGEIIQIWWQVGSTHYPSQEEAAQHATFDKPALLYIGRTINQNLDVDIQLVGTNLQDAMATLKKIIHPHNRFHYR